MPRLIRHASRPPNRPSGPALDVMISQASPPSDSPGLPVPRLRDLPPAFQWLLFSAWCRDARLSSTWHASNGSSSLLRVGKIAAAILLRRTVVRESVRRFWWRRVNPSLVELAYGTTSSVFRDPDCPDRVFKPNLLSVLDDPPRREIRITEMRTSFADLATRLGGYLEPTSFEVRNIGATKPIWVSGSVQRWVVGQPFAPSRLKKSAQSDEARHLQRQWREICALAKDAYDKTGRLLDVGGRDNIVVEYPAGKLPRLVIVDTIAVNPLSNIVYQERTKRLLAEGAPNP